MTVEINAFWRNFIDGRWVDAMDGRRRTVFDPATAAPLAEVALGGAADVDAAVAAAQACVAARALVSVRPAQRLRWVMDIGRALHARRDRAAHVLSRDSGKALSEAYTEVDGTIRYFEYYGALADKLEGTYIPLGDGYVDYTVPVPHGVSAHVIPWNYPAEMVGRGVAPALAAGNAVVIKAPEIDPLGCHVVVEAAEAAGLPPGAVNLVTGDGPEAGAALVRHPGVDQIVFTGSVNTGRSILHAAADRIVPTVMELGGKAAAIVFDDADLDALVASTRWGIFMNAGQVCSAMSRIVVTDAVHDEVVDRVTALGEGLRVGAGIEEAELTPVVSATQLGRVTGFTERALADGASAATGGAVIDRPGWFMAPTVLVDVDPHADVARSEVFGPVLTVLRVSSADEAIDVANGTDYGLAAGVFTRDLDRALWTADRLVAGQVFVNEWYAGGVETPFGGVKRSGFGREKGQEALRNYVQTKNVAIRVDDPRVT
ncbi:MAG TPA: aldehyde dehydrogenase family protein [Euzebyales bacterium]|nr:aldehyde dehydrogenase family protein [Euzebyales bacterium]